VAFAIRFFHYFEMPALVRVMTVASPVYRHCLHCYTWSRVYATAGRPSVCLSVPPDSRTPLQRVCCCGSCGYVGDIDRLLHAARRAAANADCATQREAAEHRVVYNA